MAPSKTKGSSSSHNASSAPNNDGGSLPDESYPKEVRELLQTIDSMPKEGLVKMVDHLRMDETASRLSPDIKELLTPDLLNADEAVLRKFMRVAVRSLAASDARRNVRKEQLKTRVQLITFGLAAIIITFRLWQQGLLDGMIKAFAEDLGSWGSWLRPARR